MAQRIPRGSVVQRNPWGDPKAAIAVTGQTRSAPARAASGGPAENPPTSASPMRMRYKMAGGR